jgi:hypothetical protein
VPGLKINWPPTGGLIVRRKLLLQLQYLETVTNPPKIKGDCALVEENRRGKRITAVSAMSNIKICVTLFIRLSDF